MLSLVEIQIHIAKHCNLNCYSCNNFSSVADEEYPNIKEVEADLARLAFLTKGEINNIQLCGGEPLLNKDIIEYFKIIRHYFSNSAIDIVTNGILLKKMPESFWQACSDYDVTFDPSIYPIKIDWDWFKNKCNSYGIKYHLTMDKSEFCKLQMDEQGLRNPYYMFNLCFKANHCVTLEKGVLYTCPEACEIKTFNKKFGTHFPENNGIDIYKAKNLHEILEFLATPIRFCGYCAEPLRTPIKWKRTTRMKEEWIRCDIR